MSKNYKNSLEYNKLIFDYEDSQIKVYENELRATLLLTEKANVDSDKKFQIEVMWIYDKYLKDKNWDNNG